MFYGSLPGKGQIAEVAMHVVEKIGDEALRNDGLGVLVRVRGLIGVLRELDGLAAGFFGRKARYVLRLAFPVEKLEVFLLEARDGLTMAIADDYRDHHQIDPRFESGLLIVSGHFRDGLFGLRGSLRRRLLRRRLRRR